MVRLARHPSSLARFAFAGALFCGALARGSPAAKPLSLNEVETLFLFGDSYTQNGPLGYNVSNQLSITSAGGPAWPDYLVKDPAAPPSLRESYFDFGRGGATISAERQLVGYPNVSLSSEVDLFETYFTDSKKAAKLPGRPKWRSNSTLFSIWFGINDIEITWRRGEEFPPLVEGIFDEFQSGVDRLYKLGARHFLLPLLPPYHRTPLFTHVFPSARDTIQRDFTLWNDRLRQFAAELVASKKDASVVVWDAWADFELMLDRPSEFAFLNSDSYCDAYAAYVWAINPPSSISNIPQCAVPLSQYVWIDKSHPSTEVHRRVIAKSIARLLTNPPSSATPKTGLLRRSLHLPTHRRPPSLPVAALPAHDRFARLVRRADAAAGGAEPGFWGKLRDAAVGSVVAGARVGQ